MTRRGSKAMPGIIPSQRQECARCDLEAVVEVAELPLHPEPPVEAVRADEARDEALLLHRDRAQTEAAVPGHTHMRARTHTDEAAHLYEFTRPRAHTHTHEAAHTL